MRMHRLTGLLLAVLPFPALADAVWLDGFHSSDNEDLTVTRLAGSYLWDYADIEHYQGLRVERVRFDGAGYAEEENRLYYRFAGTRGDLKWNGAIGSNGDSWLGNASVWLDTEARKELFLERERVESRQALANDVYATFVGGAADFPLGERFTLVTLLGLQDFTGDNLRTHARARLVYALQPDWGLTAQLRTRYWRNSDPYEYDYFSPDWYGEALAVLGWRRHVGDYQLQAAIGYGRQRASDRDQDAAELLEFGVTSPKRGPWYFKLTGGYTTTPVGTNYAYRYRYVFLDLIRSF